MKLSLIVLILLSVTACAPQPTALSQQTQIPIPIVATSESPVTSVMISSTSVPVCTCPNGIVTPTQSMGEVIGLPSAICNCPAILVSPPAEATEVGSDPQNISTTGITLADNGETFTLHSGDSFLLNLGMDEFDWTVDIDNQNVLSRVEGVMVIRGAQGVYEANRLGQAMLIATGNPLCRKSVPACAMPSIMFRITVIVP
jgi:hypothetical protein